MGTRHLIEVYSDGERKVSQYGQWDGYPEGAGVNVLRFLRTADLDKFRKAVRACSWLDDDDVKQAWVDCGADPGSNWVSFDVSNRMMDKYPELHRSTGAAILPLIALRGGCRLKDEHYFAADGLFCEYAYVVDLDKNLFEVYEGLQTQTHPHGKAGAFDDLEPVVRSGDSTPEYYPVALVAAYRLDQLPTEEKFLFETETTTEA